MTRQVFVAISTTGPAVYTHDVWEIGLIKRHDDGSDHESQWFLRPGLAKADPDFLADSRFYERTAKFPETNAPPARAGLAPLEWSSPGQAARAIAYDTANAVLVGWDITFTAAMLERFLRDNKQAPAWQSRPVDVETLYDGFWRGRGLTVPQPPFDPATLDPAIDRARWFRNCFDEVLGFTAASRVSA